MDRCNLRRVTGLYTGHCQLNKHLHNMGLTESSTCRLCGMEDETAFHIICGCDALARVRYLHFGCDRITDTKLCEMMDPMSLLRFVKATGLF